MVLSHWVFMVNLTKQYPQPHAHIQLIYPHNIFPPDKYGRKLLGDPYENSYANGPKDGKEQYQHS